MPFRNSTCLYLSTSFQICKEILVENTLLLFGFLFQTIEIRKCPILFQRPSVHLYKKCRSAIAPLVEFYFTIDSKHSQNICAITNSVLTLVFYRSLGLIHDAEYSVVNSMYASSTMRKMIWIVITDRQPFGRLNQLNFEPKRTVYFIRALIVFVFCIFSERF